MRPPLLLLPLLPILLPLSVLTCARSTPGPGSTPLPLATTSLEVAGPVRLEPGQAAELSVDVNGKVRQRLSTPNGTERFVLILASTRFDADAPPSPYTLAFHALPHPEASTRPSPLSPAQLLTGCSLSNEHFSGTALPTDPPPTGTPPLEGALRTFQIPARAEPEAIQARALSVGEHAVIWADTTHPTTLDRAFVSQFRDDFERVILPRARQVFGTEPDLDRDGRIQLVFTRLTRERGVAFFSSCDLARELDGCRASNHGEYLYLTPPDAIDPPYNTPNAIKEILAHEVAHLLHFQRKVLRNQLTQWQDGAYLCEGIGALAQDVTGYQAGNLYVTRAALDGIDQFSLGDVLHGTELDRSREGVLRGGAYLFVRYLYDRAGGDAASALAIENRGGPTLLRALLDAPVWLDQALPRVTSTDTANLALDFYTALALSNREDIREGIDAAPAANPCFRYLPTQLDPITQKQRGANLFARFHGAQMQGPKSGDARSPDGQLRPGGVDYLQLDASPGTPEIPLTITLDPRTAPRVRIARLQ